MLEQNKNISLKYCLKNNFSLEKRTRNIFQTGPEKQPDKLVEAPKTSETLKMKDWKEITLPKAVECKNKLNNLDAILADLAKEAYPDDKKAAKFYAEDIKNGLIEQLSEHQIPLDVNRLFPTIFTNDQTPKITIEKGGFRFFNDTNNDNKIEPAEERLVKYPTIEIRGTEKIQKPGQLILEARSEKRISVDENTRKEEEVADKAQQDAEAFRAKYIKDSIVKFPTSKELHEIGLKNFYPKVQPGDTVVITPNGQKTPKTATFDGKDWFYIGSTERVKILNGDRIVVNFSEKKITLPPTPDFLHSNDITGMYEHQGVQNPIKIPRELENFSWRQTAALLNSNEDFGKMLKARNISIDDYAKLLEKYADTKNGYYWLVIPKAKTQSVEEQQKIVLEKDRDVSQQRTNEGIKQFDQTKENIFNKHIGHLYNNEKYVLKEILGNEKLSDLINKGREKWIKIWNEGNLKNVEGVKNAFTHSAFNTISEGARAGLMWDTLHFTAASNGFQMEDFIKQCNKLGEPKVAGKVMDFDELKENYFAENAAAKVNDNIKKGFNKYQGLSSDEKDAYEEKSPNNPYLGQRLNEYKEIFAGAGMIIESVLHLAPQESGRGLPNETTVPIVKKEPSLSEIRAKDLISQNCITRLEEVLPTLGQGNIQNLEDIKPEGKVVAGEGISGLFRFVFKEQEINTNDLDKVFSGRSAFRMILDESGLNTGKIDAGIFSAKLNNFIKKGIAKLNTEGSSPEKTEALQRMGIQDAELKDPRFVENIFSRLNLAVDINHPFNFAQVELIKLGLILDLTTKQGRRENEPEKNHQWMSEDLSKEPQMRRMQLAVIAASEKGEIPKENLKEKLKQMEEKYPQAVKSAIESINVGVAVDVASGKVTLGAAIPVVDFGNGWNLLVSAGAETDGTIAVGAGISKGIDLSQNVKLTLLGMLGVRIGPEGLLAGLMPGAIINWRIPVDGSKWDDSGKAMLLGIPGIAGFLGATVGKSLNIKKEIDEKLEEKLAKSGYSKVEQAINNNTPAVEIARLMREVPGELGMTLSQIQLNLGLNDPELVDFYITNLRQDLRDQAANETGGFKLTQFEVGAGVIELGPVLIPMPLLTIAFSIGSRLYLYQEPTKSSQQMQGNIDEALNQQYETQTQQAIAKIRETNPQFKEIKVRPLKSAKIVGNRKSNEAPLRPLEEKNVVKEESHEFNAGNLDQKADAENFKKLQEAMHEKGLDINLVPPGQPMAGTYHLSVLNAGNLKIFVDPQMLDRSGVLEYNGEIYLAARKNPNLIIKRSEKYFGKMYEGSEKETVITFSDLGYRKQANIMRESGYFLESREKISATGPITGERQRLHLSKNTLGNKAQWNIRSFAEDQKYYNPNLEQYTERFLNTSMGSEPETDKIEEQKTMGNYVSASKDAYARIEGAKMEALDTAEIRKDADKFLKEDPIWVRKLTTIQSPAIKSLEDVKKLDAKILQKFPQYKGKSDALDLFKEEVYNLTMSEAEKEGRSKQEILKSRIELAKMVYTDYFQGKSAPYRAEELAETFLNPIRKINVKGTPAEKIEAGISYLTMVGTKGIYGLREMKTTGVDVPDHQLIPSGVDYEAALKQKEMTPNKKIAQILLDQSSPMENIQDEAEFLKSPLAIKLFTLGKGKTDLHPLISMLEGGYKTFSKLSEAYKGYPNLTINKENQDAITKFHDLTIKIREAQKGERGVIVKVDGKDYQAITLDDGTIVAIKTTIKSGVYERCINPTSVQGEDILVFPPSKQRPPTYEAGLMVLSAHDSMTLNSQISREYITLGIMAGVTAREQVQVAKENGTPGQTGRVNQVSGSRTATENPTPVYKPAPGAQDGLNAGSNGF